MRNGTYSIPVNLEQLLEVLKQLPRKEKIKVAQVLEHGERKKTLTNLLKSFRTDELSEETINAVTEKVRHAR